MTERCTLNTKKKWNIIPNHLHVWLIQIRIWQEYHPVVGRIQPLHGLTAWHKYLKRETAHTLF